MSIIQGVILFKLVLTKLISFTLYNKSDKEFKISTDISNKGLWLPSSVTLKDKQIEFISTEIRKFFTKITWINERLFCDNAW